MQCNVLTLNTEDFCGWILDISVTNFLNEQLNERGKRPKNTFHVSLQREPVTPSLARVYTISYLHTVSKAGLIVLQMSCVEDHETRSSLVFLAQHFHGKEDTPHESL